MLIQSFQIRLADEPQRDPVADDQDPYLIETNLDRRATRKSGSPPRPQAEALPGKRQPGMLEADAERSIQSLPGDFEIDAGIV